MLVKFSMIRPDKFADLVKFVESDDNCVKTQVAERKDESTGAGPIVVREREVTFVELINYKKSVAIGRDYFLEVELKIEDDVVYSVEEASGKQVSFRVPVPMGLFVRVLTLLGLDAEALGDNRSLVNKYGTQIDSDEALKLWRAMQEKFGNQTRAAVDGRPGGHPRI